MSDVAAQALHRLLTSAESARSRGASGRKVTLSLTDASFPPYLQFARAEDKQAANMAFLAAERAGAIEVEWDSRAGERSHASRLLLKDAEALAQHLQAEPRWAAVARARQVLEPLAETFPVLREVLERWSRGLKVRGTSPEDAGDWLDAARVLQYCHSIAAQDVAVRRASAHIFRNSKRIQDVWRYMEVLSTGNVQPTQKDMEEVLAGFGLVKFPPTFLIAGDGALSCRGAKIPVAAPYVGISPSELVGVQFFDAPRLVLSVENLTTFHELAATRPASAVLLYTGGMPARSWTAAYRKVLEAVPGGCHILHWGDIDAGGFRISSHLAETCQQEGRTLRLHAMAWRAPELADAGRAFAPAEVKQIEGICSRWNWKSEKAAIVGATHPIEQEELPAVWPPLVP